MSRRVITSLMTILLLAAFAFASSMQQSNTQSEPAKQDKAQPTPTKQDKAQSAPAKQDKAPGDPAKQDKAPGELTKQDPTPSPTSSDATQNTAPSTPTLNPDDSAFLKDAAHDGMMEVQLGHLALDKATDPEVKQFAQRLIDDHSQANQNLMALASRKGLTLPAMSDTAMMNSSSQSADQATATSQAMEQQSATEPSATKERHARVDTNAMLKDEKAMNRLSKLSGDAFDREFIEMQVKAHEKDVKEFKKVSMNAKDPDVRDFAANTLPTLDAHLTMARHIQDRLNSKKK
jgi:putative membrane protein